MAKKNGGRENHIKLFQTVPGDFRLGKRGEQPAIVLVFHLQATRFDQISDKVSRMWSVERSSGGKLLCWFSFEGEKFVKVFPMFLYCNFHSSFQNLKLKLLSS